MSYQQFPPGFEPGGQFGGSPPTVVQPTTPFAGPPVRTRKPALIGAGVVVLLAGAVGGVLMIMASGSNYDDGVASLARAPIGCTTTLQFDQTGTFTVYVETVGEIGRLRGDCPGTESDYRYRGDGLPDVEIDLVDPDGDRVELDDNESLEYDANGSVGRSISTFDIAEAGGYEITVTSDDDDFAIAVGKDPKGDADSLKTLGLAAVVAGAIVGAVLVLLGLRRSKPTGPSSPLADGGDRVSAARLMESSPPTMFPPGAGYQPTLRLPPNYTPPNYTPPTSPGSPQPMTPPQPPRPQPFAPSPPQRPTTMPPPPPPAGGSPQRPTQPDR